jgi:hypothetical protein
VPPLLLPLLAKVLLVHAVAAAVVVALVSAAVVVAVAVVLLLLVSRLVTLAWAGLLDAPRQLCVSSCMVLSGPGLELGTPTHPAMCDHSA